MHSLAFISNLVTGPDALIILVVVLIIFGPKKLPELAKGMGQAIKEFHKAKDEISRELSKTEEVAVQPAPGQVPRQPAELPAVQVAPVAQVTPIAPPPVSVEPAAQVPRPVEEVHPAGQV
jgi:sec-independent protein translocase protein TatA